MQVASEADAHPHHSPVMPRLQQDLPARAAHEVLAGPAPPRAPCAVEMRTRPPVRSREPGPGRRDARGSVDDQAEHAVRAGTLAQCLQGTRHPRADHRRST